MSTDPNTIDWKIHGYKQLGDGSKKTQCMVYKNNKYVIKQIKDIFDYPARISQYLREIKMLYYVRSNPYFVSLKYVISNSQKTKWNTIDLVFDLMDNDLSNVLKRKQKLSKIEIKHILYQLISALYTLHNINITHRDIKPQNILVNIVNNTYNIQLCDFGSSIWLD
eukprot:294248_1